MSRVRRPTGTSRPKMGFSLMELVVSSVSAMTLIAGLTSSIMIVSRATSPNTGTSQATPASLTLDEIVAEMRTLKRIVTRGSREITFVVDDRSTDADLVDETIRYSWDGISGSTLVRTYNNVSTTVISDVHNLNFTYLIATDPNPKRVLFLQGNVTGTQSSYDNQRVQNMQGWGYTVTRKTTIATTDQADLEAAAFCSDAVYVSTSLTADDLNTKLKNTPVPVIVEMLQLTDSFGFSTVDSQQSSERKLQIFDNKHYITLPFSSGDLNILDVDTSQLAYLVPTYAPGLQTLCRERTGTYPNLALVAKGETLADSTSAAGLRIVVPWGGTVNPVSLTSNGLTLWQRTLDWAARKQVLTAIELTLQLSSSAGANFYARAELLGRPRP